ncbi:Hypothetical protein GbCGDNIH9_7230 [Granulibacter bethesdensis]|uniref:Uncharacterized protein n=1 Tax=Granulibacter bethesdensis TaxID=364410 RepID=A0AAC9KFP8_9PROT|nr:Hypothetical protein GbCGDNIH9_7230 [Granulibacter bethesdensis]APH63064.1 Hypothetical protein GbCGDNIH8_7230 [Granulibacter bethesdensis]
MAATIETGSTKQQRTARNPLPQWHITEGSIDIAIPQKIKIFTAFCLCEIGFANISNHFKIINLFIYMIL